MSEQLPIVAEEKAEAKAEEKILTPEPEKIIEPLIFSGSQSAPQAAPSGKMQYAGRDKGRQRKFYETIALLEMYHAGDTRIWNKLDEQMQRYYRREYPEYFGRDGKGKQEKRKENKIKAARIRHERFQREARSTAKIPRDRLAPIDLQERRKQISGG